MKFIKSTTFQESLQKLKKRYPKIENDIDFFESNFNNELWVHLGQWLYKYRLKNSSIPTGQRSWYRIIIFFSDGENIVFLTIYAKTIRENISLDEIHDLVDQFLNS